MDVLIAQIANTGVSDIDVSDPALCDRNGNFTCDYFTIPCIINIPKSRSVKHKVLRRKLRSTDAQSFKEDLTEPVCDNGPDSDPLEASKMQHNAPVDKHAALIEHFVYICPNSQWSTHICAARRNKRKLEKQWRKSGLVVHHYMYRRECSKVNTEAYLSIFVN